MHRNEDWDMVARDGPVIATAIHDGHAMRDSLQPYLAIDADALAFFRDKLRVGGN
jgi:hypothetical protein